MARNAHAHHFIHADGRPPDVVAFEVSVVGFFVDAAELLGVPRSVAAIYGICFASPEPLSFAEIRGRLAISKGSVSQGLRFLSRIGALVDVSEPGARITRYRPDVDMRMAMLHNLEERVQKQLDAGETGLRDIRASVPRSDPAVAGKLEARVKSLADWHARSRALLPLIKGALRLTLSTSGAPVARIPNHEPSHR